MRVKENHITAPITGSRVDPLTRHRIHGVSFSEIIGQTNEGDRVASIYKESVYLHIRGTLRVIACRLPLAKFPDWTHGFLPALDPEMLWQKVKGCEGHPLPEVVMAAIEQPVE